jgi:hypothetical protein
MNLIKQSRFASYRYLANTGLSATFFRHLFRKCDIGVGSRVRIVGDTDGDVSTYLKFLGVDVFSASHSSNQPPLKMHAAESCDDASDFADTPFDLILSCVQPSAESSLLDETAVQATVGLLSSLRPGGFGVFITASFLGSKSADNPSPQAENKAGHSVHCQLRQLECFPGASGMKTHRLGWFSSLVRKLRGNRGSGLVESAMLRIPEYSVTSDQWQAIAQNATLADHEPCCDNVSNMGSTHRLPKAA